MYNCLTSNNTESGNKYAKIFELKKSYKGNTDWHNNQICFKIFQSNSYNGYIERDYFLATIKGNGEQSTIFHEISGKTYSSFKAVIVEDTEKIVVYVKGVYEYVPVRVKINYCYNIGMINFINYGKFNNDLTTFTEAKVNNKSFNINFESGWTINNEAYNNFSVKNNLVKLKCRLTSGVLTDNTKIANISDFKPSKPLYCFTNFQDSDGNLQIARVTINEWGDILISKMNNKSTTMFDIDISYYI